MKKLSQEFAILLMKQNLPGSLSNFVPQTQSLKTSSHKTPFFRKLSPTLPPTDIMSLMEKCNQLAEEGYAKTDIINRTQIPAPSRGFTNRNRHLPLVKQDTEQSNLLQNTEYQPQSPDENTRKRRSGDFAFR